VSTTVTIDSVTTGDAAPTTAPHRISNKATKDTATLKFTPTQSGGGAVKAYMVREGGATPYTGTLLGRRGLVCSDSETCSDTDPNKRCTEATTASGAQITETITYAETGGPADGAQTVNVYASAGTDGWV
jgi:hypothetical protein